MFDQCRRALRNEFPRVSAIYMLFVIVVYICIFYNVIYMLFYILHEIEIPIKKLYLYTQEYEP